METRKETDAGADTERSRPASDIQKGTAVFNTVTLETGLVDHTKKDCLAIAVRCTVDGNLHREEVVMPAADCRAATMKEKTAFQRILNRDGLFWNRRKCELAEASYIPHDGQLVKLSILGENVILGAFREIRKGKIIMYCMMRENEPPRYSLNETAGDIDDFQVAPIGSCDRNCFSAALKKEGLVWNGRLRQLETLKMRAPKGRGYYYLDEHFNICQVQDTYKKRDRKRREAGNYFTSLRDIQQVRECFMAILKMKHGVIGGKE